MKSKVVKKCDLDKENQDTLKKLLTSIESDMSKLQKDADNKSKVNFKKRITILKKNCEKLTALDKKGLSPYVIKSIQQLNKSANQYQLLCQNIELIDDSNAGLFFLADDIENKLRGVKYLADITNELAVLKESMNKAKATLNKSQKAFQLLLNELKDSDIKDWPEQKEIEALKKVVQKDQKAYDKLAKELEIFQHVNNVLL